MTPAEAREIDRREFEAECKAIRQRAYALVGKARPRLATMPANQSSNHGPVGPTPSLFFHHGKMMSLREWSRYLGVKHSTLLRRIREGWPIELALTSENFRGRRGVVSNFASSEGTGGGSSAQETPEITFSEKAA